ncbi:chorion class B protein M3A5-like [Leguminivora glycinivorella]|uniref:chorion class B protein M3A5-like n=1 Tax=Leguminivora glycinivorella TaxID=1035111 RepID=UPI00200C1D3C|nr:chorion class B protein M3A5-like [Leguminivora glycinivorella]
MRFKVIIFSAFASLLQSITAQNCGCNCNSISIPNNGGALNIQAIGPIAPSGIAVATELGLSGDLELSGALPYLSAVEFQGQFDTSGSAPVAYGCGNCVAITQELGNLSGANGNIKYGQIRQATMEQIGDFGTCGCELLHVRNRKKLP